jgi:hypothetical protein
MTGYRHFKISGSVRPPANVAKVANDRSAADQTLATLASLAGGAARTSRLTGSPHMGSGRGVRSTAGRSPATGVNQPRATPRINNRG